MTRKYTPRGICKIDWTKPFSGRNAGSVYIYLRTDPGYGEFCHVIKSTKTKGLTRMVNDYGVDIGGQRLISQRPPKKEPAPKQTKKKTNNNVDSNVLSMKIDEGFHLITSRIDVLAELFDTVMADLQIDIKKIDRVVSELKLADDRKHGRIAYGDQPWAFSQNANAQARDMRDSLSE